MNSRPDVARSVPVITMAILAIASGATRVHAQPSADFVPVTDAMLQAPAPEDWLTWRRTTDGWGYSPLDQIDQENVGDLRMVWSRGLTQGFQSGTPLAYRGVLYMPNPNDVIQAIDAVTGDLIWEHRRDVPTTSASTCWAPSRPTTATSPSTTGSSSTRASTPTSSPSTPRPARWCGRPRSSTTA